MENNKPNNPPVHPTQKESSGGCSYIEEGMTLRDYFANSAMQASITNQTMWENLIKDCKAFGEGLTTLEYMAKEYYDIADAMLKQREL